MRGFTSFAALSLCLAGYASAQTEVLISSDIVSSTTWTANNRYNLQNQIYVRPGATLTIEAGTVIASSTGVGGSLAVTNGAQIFVQGTEANPVIMTSTADFATWTAGDPTTGNWRERANEWGNLTIMGDAYISEDATPGNSPAPNANNVAAMEGLVAAFPGDTDVEYGGGNDDDDSGEIHYLSIRYGGRVIGLNNELNGLSLGGIGRETDIDHVEIMNNVDDGIEVWGGTCNFKYLSIWNIGDDSFDIDQGWRGICQYLLVVQGHSLDANQGSGVGDNMVEHDGAENSHWQPRTRGRIVNYTLIGQPLDGDGATAWRDNCGMQYQNGIITDCGERVVRFDNVDGDGAQGYGFMGTLSWAQHWTTPASTFPAVNAPANPAAFYRAQDPSRSICVIDNTVFYNNNASGAYTEANARGIANAALNNVIEPSNSPIMAITRGATINRGGKAIQPVTFLDPRPAADALMTADVNVGVDNLDAAQFRGAFRPGSSWLTGWTASDAFGFTPGGGVTDIGCTTPVGAGDGNMWLDGPLTPGSAATVRVNSLPANQPCVLLLGAFNTPIDLPILDGVKVVPSFATAGGSVALATDGNGEINLPIPWNFPTGTRFYTQVVCINVPTLSIGATNALSLVSQ